MGRNSHLGGSTVIRPASSWFSKPKKKRPRTAAQRQTIRGVKAEEHHKRQVMTQLRQQRLATERKRLPHKARRQLRMLEEAALRAKAEKKRKREETARLQQERRSAQKRARQEQARLQPEKTVAEQTAQNVLHATRTEAARTSKASHFEEQLLKDGPPRTQYQTRSRPIANKGGWSQGSPSRDPQMAPFTSASLPKELFHCLSDHSNHLRDRFAFVPQGEKNGQNDAHGGLQNLWRQAA